MAHCPVLWKEKQGGFVCLQINNYTLNKQLIGKQPSLSTNDMSDQCTVVNLEAHKSSFFSPQDRGQSALTCASIKCISLYWLLSLVLSHHSMIEYVIYMHIYSATFSKSSMKMANDINPNIINQSIWWPLSWRFPEWIIKFFTMAYSCWDAPSSLKLQ